MTNYSKPILVTGSHRSGTTWTGNMIAMAKNVFYIPEPFAPNGILAKQLIPPYWYYYLSGSNRLYYEHLTRLASCGYTLKEALCTKDEFQRFYYKKLPEKLKFYRESLFCKHTRYIAFRPLFKDPFMLFSAEWITENLNAANIILIRHPAAFVGSVLKVGWRFNFNNLLMQTELVDKHLFNYYDELVSNKNDHLYETCLLWNCIHQMIRYYHNNHPEWIFLRHEDLSSDPVKYFQYLYNKIDLEFTPEIKSAIINYTTGTHPLETRAIHDIRRDSRANIKNWKRRLSKEQINRIRRLTEPIAAEFYDDSDW